MLAFWVYDRHKPKMYSYSLLVIIMYDRFTVSSL